MIFLDLKHPQTDSDHQSLILKGKCAIKHSKPPVSCENTPKLKWVCPKLRILLFSPFQCNGEYDEPGNSGYPPCFGLPAGSYEFKPLIISHSSSSKVPQDLSTTCTKKRPLSLRFSKNTMHIPCTIIMVQNMIMVNPWFMVILSII